MEKLFLELFVTFFCYPFFAPSSPIPNQCNNIDFTNSLWKFFFKQSLPEYVIRCSVWHSTKSIVAGEEKKWENSYYMRMKWKLDKRLARKRFRAQKRKWVSEWAKAEKTSEKRRLRRKEFHIEYASIEREKKRNKKSWVWLWVCVCASVTWIHNHHLVIQLSEIVWRCVWSIDIRARKRNRSIWYSLRRRCSFLFLRILFIVVFIVSRWARVSNKRKKWNNWKRKWYTRITNPNDLIHWLKPISGWANFSIKYEEKW